MSTLDSAAVQPSPISSTTHPVAARASSVSPLWYLLLGGALVFLSQLRWGLGSLAWVAPVPLLYYVRVTRGWRSWLLFGGAMLVALHLTVAKIVTPPISFALVPMFAVPGALSLVASYLVWSFVRRRAGEVLAVFGFAALAAVGEWATYATGQLGTWGGAVNTQLANVPLLQLASLFGPAAIAFVMGLTAALIEAWLAGVLGRRARWYIAALAVMLVAVHAWGALRADGRPGGPELRVAGVVSDLLANGRLPGDAERHRGTDELFARSVEAARAGAKLVVWNEAATFVPPAEEPALVARASAFAREHRVEFVIAYAVLLRLQPMRFENKYVWLLADGSTAEEYEKHHPVPGEGAVASTAPVRLAGSRLGRLAGAICYDYDFPQMGRAHARAGAGLVVVPSSDWRGIDPIHTEMAKLRAIEGGFSVLRPVRAATSAAYDAFGRRRAALDYFADNDRILLATVPIRPVWTLYGRIGDVAVVPAGLYLLGVIGLALVRRR